MINGREITLILTDNERFGTHTVRVAANRFGKSTNIQTVQLLDGKIAGTSDHKTLNDQVIYCMMIDRFNNGDPSMIIQLNTIHFLLRQIIKAATCEA